MILLQQMIPGREMGRYGGRYNALTCISIQDTISFNTPVWAFNFFCFVFK